MWYSTVSHVWLILLSLGEQGFARWWERSRPTNEAQVQFRPGAIDGLTLSLVVVLLRGFFSGFSGFAPSTKSNISIFQFDQDIGPARNPATADEAFSLNIVIIYIYIISPPFPYKRACHVGTVARSLIVVDSTQLFVKTTSWQLLYNQFFLKLVTEGTYLVRMKQKRGRYSLKSSGMSLILEIARKYVIPLVGCSQYCTGTPAVGKNTDFIQLLWSTILTLCKISECVTIP